MVAWRGATADAEVAEADGYRITADREGASADGDGPSADGKEQLPTETDQQQMELPRATEPQSTMNGTTADGAGPMGGRRSKWR